MSDHVERLRAAHALRAEHGTHDFTFDDDDVEAALDELEKLRAERAEPHQGLTEDAFVQLFSESTGTPVHIVIGDSRPIAGGIHAGFAMDLIQLGDKQVGRVTLSTVFPDYVITGPTPETEARRLALLAELDAMEADAATQQPARGSDADGAR